MLVAADFQASVDGHTEELAVVAKAEQIRVDTTSGAVSQTYDVLQVKTLNAAATEVASAIEGLPLSNTRPTWHCSHLSARRERLQVAELQDVIPVLE